MGYFSWLDCQKSRKSRKAIKIGEKAYFLVPKEFSKEYGERIECIYGGYGHFGQYDAYDLVALFNREHIGVENLGEEPRISQYGGLYEFEKSELRKNGLSELEVAKKDEEKRRGYYDLAMKRWKRKINRLNDFIAGVSDDDMKEKYGYDYLREIGIDIACYDEQNRALEYPIKITHDEKALYEDKDCVASKGDPNQGCS